MADLFLLVHAKELGVVPPRVPVIVLIRRRRPGGTLLRNCGPVERYVMGCPGNERFRSYNDKIEEEVVVTQLFH